MPETPLSSRWSRGSFVVILLAGLLLLGLSIYRAAHQPAPAENVPFELVDTGFVSSNACQTCHPGNYASWHASYHRTMTQRGNVETLQADMDGLELHHAGTRYEVERRGRDYFVRKGPAAGPLGAPQQIVLVTGSHQLQIPWMETEFGRTLEQFPFGYIIEEKMWAPVTQTFLMPPELKEIYSLGAWNGACMDCHVTQGRSRFVEGNRWDTQVTEFGISCEACHGNGAAHVAANRNPLRRWKMHLTGAPDPTIANAGRMSGPASALACGQCHSVWAFKGMDEKIDFNRHGAGFRPGQEDLEKRFVVQPQTADHSAQKDFIRQSEPDFFRNRFWGDGMIRVTGREYNGVAASPCFKGGEFSCLSCHQMHPERPTEARLDQWKDDQMKPHMESDRACLQCHQSMASNISAHTHHAANSSGSSCYNCHMPHTTFGLLKAIRSHQVSSPSAAESVEHGRPNACNLCHLDQTLAWTADHLQAWFGQTPPPLGPDDRELAASVQWLVKGDAAQRALLAWGMGWKPARETTGDLGWFYPYLIYTLTDPYAAIRFNAWRSLRALPGFADFSFTYTDPDEKISETARAAYARWMSEVKPGDATFPGRTGLESNGAFRPELMNRLRAERDNSPVLLAE